MEDAKSKQWKKFVKHLDEEWRNEIEGLKTSEEVRERIVRAAMANVQLAMAKEFDADLKSLAEKLATARSQYTEGTKDNNLRIEFCIAVLRSRGEDVPSLEDFMRAVREGDDVGGDDD